MVLRVSMPAFGCLFAASCLKMSFDQFDDTFRYDLAGDNRPQVLMMV